MARLNYWGPKNPKYSWQLMLNRLRKGVPYCIYCASDIAVELITLQMVMVFFPCPNDLKSLKAVLLNPNVGFKQGRNAY